MREQAQQRSDSIQVNHQRVNLRKARQCFHSCTQSVTVSGVSWRLPTKTEKHKRACTSLSVRWTLRGGVLHLVGCVLLVCRSAWCVPFTASYRSTSLAINLIATNSKHKHIHSYLQVNFTYFSGVSANFMRCSWFWLIFLSRLRIIFLTPCSSRGSTCNSVLHSTHNTVHITSGACARSLLIVSSSKWSSSCCTSLFLLWLSMFATVWFDSARKLSQKLPDGKKW